MFKNAYTYKFLQNCTQLKLCIKLRVRIVLLLLQVVLLKVTHNQSPFPQREE